MANESNRKRVEHLTGGIVEQILVKDGDGVKAGDALVGMNPVVGQSPPTTSRRSTWPRSPPWRASARSVMAVSTIAFPTELVAMRDLADAASLMQAQNQLLRSRRLALNELRIMRESVRGLESQIRGLAKLKAGQETQMTLLNEQLRSCRNLRSEGYVSRNRLLEMERHLCPAPRQRAKTSATSPP